MEDEDGNWTVENMGYPMNSSQDDFGISFVAGKDQGLFSFSNRKGSRSDDIYSLWCRPSFTRRRVTSSIRRPVPASTGPPSGSYAPCTNLRMRADNGKFQVKLNPATEYVFAAVREGFLD